LTYRFTFAVRGGARFLAHIKPLTRCSRDPLSRLPGGTVPRHEAAAGDRAWRCPARSVSRASPAMSRSAGAAVASLPRTRPGRTSLPNRANHSTVRLGNL